MKNTFLLLCFICASFGSLAQKIPLSEKIKDKETLDGIMQVVDQHYKDIEDGKIEQGDDPRYKKWVRWAHFMSSRTGKDGQLVNRQKMTNAAVEELDRVNPAKSSAGDWAFIGPQDIDDSNNTNSAIGIARVDRIAFHPSNSNIIYIGTPAGGLYRSGNGGLSWSARSDNLPSTGISGIVVSNDDPNKIYILTGDGDSNLSGGLVRGFGYIRPSSGVFVSYDQGLNWTKLGDLPITDSYLGYELIQHPTNANILLAATTEGIFRTTDGGWNWTQITTQTTYELKYKPNSSSIIYATESGDFLRSTDSGVSFDYETIPASITNSKLSLAVTNANPNWVYLLASGNGNSSSTYDGLYLSVNSGASFGMTSNSPNIVNSSCDGQGTGNFFPTYALAMAASHSSSLDLVTGSIRCWRSSNGGVTMANASPTCSNSFSTGTVHADIHDIEYNPLTDEVFVCSDGGVHKSSDHGQTWVSLCDGITASQIYRMAGSNANTTQMLIGLQDNGFKSKEDASNTWTHRRGADGFDAVYDNGSSSAGYWTYNQSMQSFTNNGANRVGITPNVPNDPQWFGRVARSNTNSDIVLAGYRDIMRSTDGGNSWTNTGASGNWALESCPSNSNRFYAAGGNASTSNMGRQIYRSDDVGQTWNALTSIGLPLSTDNIKVTGLEARPTNSNSLWVTMGGYNAGEKVYFYNNNTSTWTNLSGSLPNVPVHCIVVDTGNNAYIGTDLGIFYRGLTMNDWVPFWNGIPFVPVTDLVLYESDNIIRAATFGRGVWESDTYSTCDLFHFISSNQTGNQFYEASGLITSSSTVYGGANTNVVMKSASRTTLTTGFRVFPQNKFRAYIAPCGEVDSNNLENEEEEENEEQ